MADVPLMNNPMTTQDDIVIGGASGAPTRLAKGTDGQRLTVDPSTHHLVWADPSEVSEIVDIPTAETDTSLVLAPDGAGGVEFRAEAGGGGGSDGAGECRFYGWDDGVSATVGTWGNVATTTSPYYAAVLWGNTSTAQNDALTWTRIVQAGTYTIQIRGVKNTDKPIVTVKIDGSSVGTLDFYNGSLVYARMAVTGAVIGSSGSHTIQVIFATKNASSSGYGMALSDILLYRTA